MKKYTLEQRLYFYYALKICIEGMLSSNTTNDNLRGVRHGFCHLISRYFVDDDNDDDFFIHELHSVAEKHPLFLNDNIFEYWFPIINGGITTRKQAWTPRLEVVNETIKMIEKKMNKKSK